MSAIYSHEQISSAVIHALAEQSGEEVTLQSNLESDLGLDSIDYCETAITLESLFDIGPVPDDDLFKLVTVEQVVQYVEAWKQKQLEALAARAAEA